LKPIKEEGRIGVNLGDCQVYRNKKVSVPRKENYAGERVGGGRVGSNDYGKKKGSGVNREVRSLKGKSANEKRGK